MAGILPPEAAAEQVGAATSSLLATAARLTQAEVRGGSLLPGWTRGHVLTHLARNAEGGVRLLDGVRTGVAGQEYESLDARAAAIEAGAGRSAAVLVQDLAATAAAFAAAVAAVPAGAWDTPVTWTTGQVTPAATVVAARLDEVLIHHVDLAAGFTPADWPPDWVTAKTERVLASLSRRGVTFEPGQVTGPPAALLAWLLGRSDGAGLAAAGGLPALPAIY